MIDEQKISVILNKIIFQQGILRELDSRDSRLLTADEYNAIREALLSEVRV